MSLGRCGTCAREWNGTRECHCATCHLHFGSVSAFDRHRRDFACLPVAEITRVRTTGKPLLVAALASQKRHMAVYLQAIYADPRRRSDFEADYRATGKRLDVGASCVRFRTLDDLPLDLIGRTIAAVDASQFIADYEAGRARAK